LLDSQPRPKGAPGWERSVQKACGEQRDAGDLRLEGFVQFYPLVTVPFLLYLFPARITRLDDVRLRRPIVSAASA
jgi:hypothetical protein